MPKKLVSVRIDEKIVEDMNSLLDEYEISQGTVMEIGAKYVLSLNEKDFEKELLKHLKKK